MADILIRGMEMPTEEEIGKCIIVRHDGEVWIVEFDNLIDGGYVCCYPTNPMRAIPVPTHGRLIDADALREDWLENGENEHVYDTNAMLYSIDNSPTIVPAEGGNGNE